MSTSPFGENPAQDDAAAAARRCRHVIENMALGYAHCELLYDGSGKAVDFRYLEVNEAFCRLTGLKEPLGRCVSELIPGSTTAYPEILETYSRVAASGKSDRFQTAVEALGVVLSIAVQAAGPGRFVAIFDDITEKARIEAAIAASNQKLRLLFDALPVGLMVLDRDWKVLLHNRRLEEVLGLPSEAIAQGGSKEIAMLRPDGSTMGRSEYISARLKAGEKSVKGVEFCLRDGSGSLRHLLASGSTCTLPDWASILVMEDISERRRAELACRDSEAMFRLIVETAAEGIWLIDAESKTKYVNEYMARILGYSSSEMGGRDIADFLDEAGRKRAAHNLAMRKAGLSETYDQILRAKDGHAVPTRISASSLRDHSGLYLGGLAMVTDLTVNVDAQGQLAKSEHRFSAALDALPFPVLIWTGEGEVVFVNRDWTGLTGYRSEDLPSTAAWVAKAFAGRDEAVLASIVERMGSREARHLGVFELANASGKSLVWDFNTAPIGQLGDARMAFIISAVDITARVVAEREAEERRNLLIRSERLASLGVLVAGMAHEINSPNHTIALTTSLLGEVWSSVRQVLDEALAGREDLLLGGIEYAELREEMPKLIKGVQEASSHIDGIVKGLKDFSRSDEGMELSAVDVNTMVTASIAIMKPQLRKSTDNLVVQLGSGLPLVLGDFNRLEQVMVNLLQNACQALTDRSQSLVVTSLFDRERNMVLVKVKDGGIGMGAEVIEHIREPFYTTKRSSGGLGLGISISVTIVEELGGNLDWESESGEGTTATLSLPAMTQGGQVP